jgi:hypothetical protein
MEDKIKAEFNNLLAEIKNEKQQYFKTIEKKIDEIKEKIFKELEYALK